MEQPQDLYACLDAAAKETTTALTRAGIRHAFIGGYATSLIEGVRMTTDVDALVDANPNDARNLLLQAQPGFRLSQSNKLVFSNGDEGVAIELLRGGRTQQLELPDPSTVSIVYITPNDQPDRVDETPIPIVAPSVLVLTKIKRWSFLAESSRPQSVRKAERDVQDIVVLLKWLDKNDLHIDFEGYAEIPEQEVALWS
ncbi:hypothetical protein N7535_000517 [Penicillium sp. DV-2018c]|nr:hypothetical protein N7461_006237 [Penicillium sp. DV-2018c]KAJ5581897.1 hypothetical protein N7535_000517 [Penicillium sp. DV-2018c]